jgi:crotonobetainyl-CoA:carnitine CoA-transferase CaiB-like acyl-CoA transferase
MMTTVHSKEEKRKNGLMSSYRVLDLTNEMGYFCGKVLADLGADVIKIEKPGGDPARKNGPFYRGNPDPEKSLYWFAFNTNKRGITLNIEKNKGQEILIKLIKNADFMIESYPPGYLAKWKLNYAELKKINPSLIMTSITPFGQEGPYAEYKGSNLIAEAMGGLMYITGEPNDRPLSTSFDYAYLHAGIQAATATMMAHYWKVENGLGQHIDLSIQEAVLITLYNAQMLWDDSHIVQGRYGGKLLRQEKVIGGLVYPCKNGYVMWRLMGAEFAPRLIPLIRWMEEEGMAGELKDVDWARFDMSRITQEQQDHWEGIFSKFFMSKTKEELYGETVKRGMTIFPINDVAEILQDPQLEERKFWEDVNHEELGERITYPGTPFKIKGFSFSPRRSPLIGEHNQEIYCGELGISEEELASLMAAEVI